MTDFDVVCETCGTIIGHYVGAPLFLLPDTTIGGHIVLAVLGGRGEEGNVHMKILCDNCVKLEHPGTIKRDEK